MYIPLGLKGYTVCVQALWNRGRCSFKVFLQPPWTFLQSKGSELIADFVGPVESENVFELNSSFQFKCFRGMICKTPRKECCHCNCDPNCFPFKGSLAIKTSNDPKYITLFYFWTPCTHTNRKWCIRGALRAPRVLAPPPPPCASDTVAGLQKEVFTFAFFIHHQGPIPGAPSWIFIDPW